MKICIVGAGAIGATIGAKLAATGHSVSLIARGANLAALRAGGLRFVDHVDDRSSTYQLPASESAADFGVQDLVVIGLKAHAIGAMLPKMAPLIGPQTIVVPAINGLPWWYFYREGGALDGERVRALDPEGTMFAALDCRHIIGCVVHIAAESRAPGEVHHTAGRVLILGEPDDSDSERLRRICAALNEAGFEVRASTRIRLDVWTKLLGNTSFNPVAALTGYRMNEICADEGVLDVIRAVMGEGMMVAQHYGHPMPMTIEQRINLARQLGAAKISMLQDLEQKRRLELDAIVGSVIELAERAGIAVPATRMLFALAHARAKTLGIA
ncbi:MAG TPA: 2-dehydropantoate 2-reductase [Burkholderiaceae bacterium]|nr:2-dehydropantoate 2-reductase [Burkholderiaceae bacterium]